jgi:hypothetical protein
MAVKIQHLRSDVASKRPTAAGLLAGEVALNIDSGTPGAFFKDESNNIIKLGPTEVGSSAPNATPASGGSAGNTTGEFWYDTANTGGNSQAALKIYNGTAFAYVGKVTIGSTNIELGASATTTITGLNTLTSASLNATSDIDLENQADLRFFEATANGSNYVGFQAPANIAADVLWTLPAADGSADQVLSTNGSGVLSWQEARTNDISQGNSSVTVTDSGANGNIAFVTEGVTAWNINSSGHLVPGADSTFNIGASGTEVANAYIDNVYLTSLTAAGTLTLNGDVDLGNATSDTVTFTGRVDSAINPSADNAYTLGTAALRWSEIRATTLYGTVNEVTVVKSITGDTGTATPTSQTFQISGGTGLTSTAGSTTVTINLDNTAVTPAAYGSASSVATFTVDAQGRLTAAANATIDILHTQVSDFDAGVQTNRLDQMAAPTASVSLNSQKITNLADPTSAQDAATKNYVDQVAQGLDVKASVRAATTANITLSGTQTIDGVALSVDDRVLVKNQSTQSGNGIYLVKSGAWVRSSDADTWDELVSAFVFVESGTANADNGYVCTVDPGGTLGTTAVTWDQFSGAGQITAGNGLSKTGNTLDVNVDNVTLDIVSDSLQIKSTYVGQSSITTLGTITTGTWNGTIVGTTYGGTGANGTNVAASRALMAPNGSSGAVTYREILTSDIAPVTGGSFDAGTY